MLKIEPYALRVRTILNVIFCDRLYHYHDSGIAKGPLLNWLSNIELSVKDKSDGSLIQAEADWCLAYGHERAKANLAGITLVILRTEELWTHSELPRLIIYLAAIQDCRKKAKKVDCSVFGLMTDSSHYTFVYFNGDRNLFVSETYLWVTEKVTIVQWIDRILQDLIEASACQSKSHLDQLYPSKYSEGSGASGGGRFSVAKGLSRGLSATESETDEDMDEVFEAIEDGVLRHFRVVKRFSFGDVVEEVAMDEG